MRSSVVTAVVVGVVSVTFPALGYELKHDRDGDVVRWTGPLTLVVDKNLDEKLHAPGAIEAVKAAVATWKAAMPNVQLELQVGDAQKAGFSMTHENQCSITVEQGEWEYDDEVMGIAILTVDYRNNRIVDADIVLNAAQNKFGVLPADSKRGGAFADIQNTVTHELGHVLGLQHEQAHPEAVMFPMAYNGDVDKRVLSQDDMAGLDVLYPLTAGEAQPPQGCASTPANLSGALMLLAVVAVWSRRQPRALRPNRTGSDSRTRSRHLGA